MGSQVWSYSLTGEKIGSMENMILKNIYHVAKLWSKYEASKKSDINMPGLQKIKEAYRQERVSYKLDLSLNGHYSIELFSFPNSPNIPSKPEATGFRHLAFTVDILESIISQLENHNIAVEPILTHGITSRHFIFASAPDKLPIEIYEI